MLLLFSSGRIAYWLGYHPENLTQDTIDNLFDLVKVGLGGYVLGRSGEKIMKEYKKGSFNGGS